MDDRLRLIERAFPLKQASLDSVHEKNVRHGHISTLHIWPARRPLAACRAALIATLLPDPDDPEERRRIIERIGGRVVPRIEKKKVNGKPVEVEREETVGGILHWGRESSPDLQFFRDEIRKAYGGRAPRVLDRFAGGGAIPLEAMRLGCEVTAIDINPVAWFILKCTLEYPQKLAGQKRPLPDFVLHDREFMEAFFKAQGLKGATLRTQIERLPLARSVAGEGQGEGSSVPGEGPSVNSAGSQHAFNLVSEPESLPELPAVNEFIQHIGMKPPKARIAVLPFDKLDAEKGMELQSPSGKARWLRNPWSVLAYQIAGGDGLRLLHPDEKEEERDTAPAENLMTALLSMPQRENLATLVLIDEVLMYAREKVAKDPVWQGRLADFFQALTQAATKLDKCAIVASLLATDPRKSDELGKAITSDLYAIFRREREEGVQPVTKEDVAEVLRRRFFTTDSIREREPFRGYVVAALKGVTELDDQIRKEGKTAEEPFLASYPFHPDLIDAFYAKWTQLEGFQRTRGVLRTFALALREAEKWDDAPLVSTNVFLTAPDKSGISEAARELTTVATTEEYEGKKQEWTGILEGELAKARDVQNESGGLRFRELEQAVFATFLHSQPIGQKALTRELMLLLGPTRPDKIELEKALTRWSEVSWFLDEAATSDVDRSNGAGRHPHLTSPATERERDRQLPKSWRLGSRPNLRQMHHDACMRVSPEIIDARLMDEIAKLKSLTAGASAAGATVHNLPKRPHDIFRQIRRPTLIHLGRRCRSSNRVRKKAFRSLLGTA